jgi:hypothetical protein
MVELRHGNVVVVLPEGVEIPEGAGGMSDKDVRGLAKALRGVGKACAMAAHELEADHSGLAVKGVTPDGLRALGEAAEKWNGVVTDLEVALKTARQANLLADAAAFNALRRVNNQVKAVRAFDASALARYKSVVAYFKAGRTGRKPKAKAE